MASPGFMGLFHVKGEDNRKLVSSTMEDFGGSLVGVVDRREGGGTSVHCSKAFSINAVYGGWLYYRKQILVFQNLGFFQILGFYR